MFLMSFWRVGIFQEIVNLLMIFVANSCQIFEGRLDCRKLCRINQCSCNFWRIFKKRGIFLGFPIGSPEPGNCFMPPPVLVYSESPVSIFW